MKTCYICGISLSLTRHHVIPKRHKGTFTIPLCRHCHDKVETPPHKIGPELLDFAEKNPKIQLLWLIITMNGVTALSQLEIKEQISKVLAPRIRAVNEHFEKIIKRLDS